MAGIRWRVSRKVLKAFKDWVLRPSCPRDVPSHTRHARRYGLPFDFPAIGRKKLTAAFDGGRLTSDGGVLLLG